MKLSAAQLALLRRMAASDGKLSRARRRGGGSSFWIKGEPMYPKIRTSAVTVRKLEDQGYIGRDRDS
jgi:hypothetical protein